MENQRRFSKMKRMVGRGLFEYATLNRKIVSQTIIAASKGLSPIFFSITSGVTGKIAPSSWLSGAILSMAICRSIACSWIREDASSICCK